MSRDRYAFAGWLRARASNGPHANHFHSHPVLRGRVRNRWVPALRTSCEVFVWLVGFSPSGSPNAWIRGGLRCRPGSPSVAQSRGQSWHTGAHRPLGCGAWDERWDFYPTRSRNLGCLETHLPRGQLGPQLDYHLSSLGPARDEGHSWQPTPPRSRNLGCLETPLPCRPLAPKFDYHISSWAPAGDDGEFCQRTLPG